MRIKIEHNGTVFEFERKPMEIGRFAILCQLAEIMICGAVLLGLAHMLGVWGIVWSLAGLLLVGVYRLIRGGFVD